MEVMQPVHMFEFDSQRLLVCLSLYLFLLLLLVLGGIGYTERDQRPVVAGLFIELVDEGR